MELEVRVEHDATPAVLRRRRLDFEHGGELRIAHVLKARPDLLQRGVLFLEQAYRFESEQMRWALRRADTAAASGGQ